MRRRAAQRGEGNVGCIVWAVILILVGMVLWKAVPVKIANAALYDYMVELTKFAANRSPTQIRKMIVDKARDLDLPVKTQQVQVEKDHRHIKMRCTYTVPVEILGFTYEWKVEHLVDRPIYYL